MNGKQLKNSILQWAIQGKLVPQDPNDEPASVLLERIREEKARLVKEKKIKKDKNESIIFRGDDNSHYEKFADGTVKCIDDEIPFEIPQSWCWVRLAQVLTVKGGKRIPLGDSFAPGPTSHIYIRVTEMKNHTLVTNNLKYISDSVYEKIKNYTIGKDDLYLTIAGTIGSVGIVPEMFDGMNLTENAVKLTNILIDKMFLVYGISSQFVQSQFSEKTKQMAQPKLAIERILTTLIPLPPINEQISIVSRIEEIMPIADKYEKSQEALDKLNSDIFDKLKKSVLQEAIQGKLVSQDPNDEPASVLLERIREEKQRLLKEGKLKKKDITDSLIFKGEDNKYFEKIGKDVVCVDNEIPFDIPDSWMWVRTKDIFQINPKNKASDATIAAFIPMDKISATYGSAYTYDSVKWGNIKSGFTHIADGDVAFAKITPCFQNRKSAIFKGLPNGIGAATTELKVLRQYGETINRWYLLYFLESPYFIDEAEFKGTANQQRIITGYLENKLFPLPPKTEQERIVSVIEQTASIMRG